MHIALCTLYYYIFEFIIKKKVKAQAVDIKRKKSGDTLNQLSEKI